MSLAAALILTASAPAEAVPRAPVRAASASVTATASARILSPAVVRLGEDRTPASQTKGAQAETYRQRRADGRRVLIEFN